MFKKQLHKTKNMSDFHVVAVAFALLCSAAIFVEGLPNGAPTDSCTTMMPRHSDGSGGLLSGQTGTAPYSVMTSSATYKSGETVRVWITDSRSGSNPGYRGLLLQARSIGSTTPVGSWQNAPAFTKMINCTIANDAMTHSNTSLKNNATVYMWKASKSYHNISFVVTVAETHSTFWVQLQSTALSFNSAAKFYCSNLVLVITAFVAWFTYF